VRTHKSEAICEPQLSGAFARCMRTDTHFLCK